MSRATPMSVDDRRAALISATEPLLERYGRDVSTRQIAEAAGVAEGTIFRAFTTKDALVDAVVAEVFDVELTRRAILDIDPALPLHNRLVAAVTLLQDRTRRVFALFHALRWRPDGPAPNRTGTPEQHHDRQRRDQERLDEAMVALVVADADRLRLSPEETATFLRATIFALSHPMLGDETLARPTSIVDLVLHGVARTEETSC